MEPSAEDRSQLSQSTGPTQSWLELFYDLVFVAAIVVISGAYSKDYSLLQVAWLVIAFSLVWTTWLSTTVHLSRTLLVSTFQRTLLVTQMGLVLLVAVTAYDYVEDNTAYVGPLFAVILVTQLLLQGTSGPDGSVTAGQTARLALAAIVFAATWWASGVAYVGLWAVGLLLVLSSLGVWGRGRALDRHHLSHRFGEFTIIMLGESFLKIGLVATEEYLEDIELVTLPLTFALIASVWWLYFTGVGRRGIPEAPGTQPWWMLWHFPLHLLIAALAVGLSKPMLPQGYIEANQALIMISVPLAGILGSLAVLEWLTGGSHRGRRARILLGAAVLTGVATAYSFAARQEESDLVMTATALVAVALGTVWLSSRVPRD